MNKIYLLMLAGVFGIAALAPVLNGKPTQILTTRLNITIRNELGNIVEGAKVTVYATKTDYEASKNALQGGAKLTNNKGQVNFDDLPKGVYFVNAEKGSANNYNAGVQTDTLKPNRTNKFTIIISE